MEEVAAPQIHPPLSPAPAPAPAVKPSISPVTSATPLSLLVTSEKETARALEEITSLDVKASQPIAPTAGNTNSSANATPEPSLASLLVSSLERTPVYQNDEPSNEDDSQQAYADGNYLALMGQKLTALTALDEKEREVQAQSLINELIELAQLERSAGVTAVSDSQSLRRVFQQFSESYSPEIEKADLVSEEISSLSSTEEVVRVWHEPPITPPQMELSAKKTDSKDQIISLSVKEQAAKVLVDLIAGKETLAQIARDEKRGSGDGVELSVPNGTDKDLKKEFGKFFKFLTSPQKFISAIEEEQKKSNE
jgi:hypothetical protein